MKSIAIAASLFLLPTICSAQQIITVSGSCQKLVLAKKPFTPFCKGMAINSVHDNGRIGFTFLIGDKAVVTFSGTDMKNPTPDTDQLKVDTILFNMGGKGVEPSQEKVIGRCDYGNPYKGSMTIACDAKGKNNTRYSARFVTDGKPPS